MLFLQNKTNFFLFTIKEEKKKQEVKSSFKSITPYRFFLHLFFFFLLFLFSSFFFSCSQQYLSKKKISTFFFFFCCFFLPPHLAQHIRKNQNVWKTEFLFPLWYNFHISLCNSFCFLVLLHYQLFICTTKTLYIC